MTISFDGTTLDNPSERAKYVSANSFSVTYRCVTPRTAVTNMEALAAKYGGPVGRTETINNKISLQGAGTVGTLQIGETEPHANCRITAFQIIPTDMSSVNYEYVISFEQHTAG